MTVNEHAIDADENVVQDEAATTCLYPNSHTPNWADIWAPYIDDAATTRILGNELPVM